MADARARGVTFRGVGNEPGWLLEIGPDDTLTFEDRYGESRVTYDTVSGRTVAMAPRRMSARARKTRFVCHVGTVMGIVGLKWLEVTISSLR